MSAFSQQSACLMCVCNEALCASLTFDSEVISPDDKSCILALDESEYLINGVCLTILRIPTISLVVDLLLQYRNGVRHLICFPPTEIALHVT